MGNHHSFQSPARQGTPSTSIASPARASRPAPLTALERAEQSRGGGPDLRTLPLSPPERKNTTGLPDTLKAGIEGLSGLSMDEVHVHYHSPYPARLRAHAYTQGTHIYMGQGQEKHLAHEAWHVVQQMQGRVKPTTRVAATKINDDEALEREADRQGQRASTFPAPTLSAHRHLSGPLADPQSITSPPATVHLPGEPIIQRMRFEEVVAGYYYLVLVNGKKQELFLESKNDEGPAKFVFIDSSGNYILIENEDSIIEYVKEPGDREKSTEEITYLDEQYMTDRDETFNEASTLSGPQIYQEMFMEEEKKEETDSEAREDIGQAADISSLGLATWNVAHLSTHIITNKLKRLQDHLTKFSQSAPSWRALIKFVKNLLLAYDRALQQQQQQQQETEDQWSEENQPDEYVSSPKKKRQSTTKKKRASTKKKTSYDIEGEYPSSDAEYQDDKEEYISSDEEYMSSDQRKTPRRRNTKRKRNEKITARKKPKIDPEVVQTEPLPLKRTRRRSTKQMSEPALSSQYGGTINVCKKALADFNLEAFIEQMEKQGNTGWLIEYEQLAEKRGGVSRAERVRFAKKVNALRRVAEDIDKANGVLRSIMALKRKTLFNQIYGNGNKKKLSATEKQKQGVADATYSSFEDLLKGVSGTIPDKAEFEGTSRALHTPNIIKHIDEMFDKNRRWLDILILQEVNDPSLLKEKEDLYKVHTGPHLISGEEETTTVSSDEEFGKQLANQKKADQKKSHQNEYYPLLIRKGAGITATCKYVVNTEGQLIPAEHYRNRPAYWNKHAQLPTYRPIIVYEVVKQNKTGAQKYWVGIVHTTPEPDNKGVAEYNRSEIYAEVAPGLKALKEKAATENVPLIIGGDYYLSAEAIVEREMATKATGPQQTGNGGRGSRGRGRRGRESKGRGRNSGRRGRESREQAILAEAMPEKVVGRENKEEVAESTEDQKTQAHIENVQKVIAQRLEELDHEAMELDSKLKPLNDTLAELYETLEELNTKNQPPQKKEEEPGEKTGVSNLVLEKPREAMDVSNPVLEESQEKMDVSNLTLEESQEKMDVSNLTLEELKGEEETVTLALNEIPVLHEQIQSLQERIRVLQEQRQPLQEKIQLLQKIRLILLEAKKEAQILRNPRRWTVAKKIEALGLSLAQPVGGTNPKKSGPDKELNANDRFYLQIADFFVHNTHLQEVITGILDPEGGILSVDAEDLRNSRYWQHFSDHFPVGAVYATGKLSPANRQAMVRNNPQQARELANVSNINRFARLHRTRLLNKANLSEEALEKLPSHPGFLSEWKTFLHEPGFSESEQAHLWEKLHSLTTLPEEKRKDGWRELKAALNDLRSLSDKEREDAALQYLRQYLQQCRPLPSEHGNQLESIDDYIEEIQAHEIQSNVSEARRLFVTRPEDFEPDYRRSPLEAEEVSTTTTTTTITTNQPPVVIPFAARTNQGSHYASNSPVLSGSASQTSQYNPYQSLYETKIRSTGTAQTTRPPVNKASLDSLLNPDSTTPPRMTSMSFNSPTIPDSRFYTSSLSPYHHVPGQQTSFNPTPNSYQTSSYASQQAFPNLTVNTRSTRSFSDFSSDFQALAKPNLHLSQTPTLFSSQPPHNPDFNTPSITIPTLSFSGQTPLGNYGPHPYQMWSPLSSSGVQTPLKKMAPYGNPGVLSQEKVASIQVDDLVSYKPPGANLAPGKSVIAQVIHLAHGKAWISVLSSEELYEVNVAELTPVSSATTWEDF